MANSLYMETKEVVRQQPFVRDVLPAALLAPSAHNTQPWQFTVSDNAIDIYIDWSRHLSTSDPTKRQLYVSLGCAVANAAVAGDQAGYDVEVIYFPEGEKDTTPAARLTFARRQAQQLPEAISPLFTAIDARRTDRSNFDAAPLTDAERTALVSTNNPSVIFLEEREKIEAVAALTEEATLATLSRKDFKEELAHWVRNSWTRQNDGMPGYSMGVPAPLSLLSSFMVRIAPIHKQEGPKTRQQIASASAVAVIATQGDMATDWLEAGRLLEQLWLEATAAGLAASPQAAPIEAQGDIRSRLQQAVGGDEFPQIILRIGHSKQKHLRATPRRSLDDCLRTA